MLDETRDLFEQVEGDFDVIVFYPPFRSTD